MQQSWILYPMFVMVLISQAVGFRMLQLRFRAVLQDGLPVTYFKLNQDGLPPAYMMQADQHYTNLYETPVLFYAIGILVYILDMTNLFTLSMSWAYIASRLAHAYVHMGQNKIAHRRNIFLTSVAILMLLWGYVFINLLNR
jgi:hypothetical protein